MDSYTDQLGSLLPSAELVWISSPTFQSIKLQKRRGRPQCERSKQQLAIVAWTQGLKSRTANALLAHGFTTREQVAALPARRLRCIANLGEASMRDLIAWLGR